MPRVASRFVVNEAGALPLEELGVIRALDLGSIPWGSGKAPVAASLRRAPDYPVSGRVSLAPPDGSGIHGLGHVLLLSVTSKPDSLG